MANRPRLRSAFPTSPTGPDTGPDAAPVRRARPPAGARSVRAAVLAVAVVASGSLLALASPAAGADSVHVVEPGDTLSTIARDHGVATAELAAANGITDHDLIRIGQKLAIPGPAVHRVAPGETLIAIARRYGVSWSEVAALNGLANPNRLRVGQELELPGGTAAGPAVTAPGPRYGDLPRTIATNPERLALVSSFERWSSHYGVPADLLMAIAYQESGWQASVVSDKGALGVGQLMPATSAWLAQDMIGIPDLDPAVPDDNIRMSARFLAWLIAYHGDVDLAVAGYYQGPVSVRLLGPYAQTERYVANVNAARWRFQPS